MRFPGTELARVREAQSISQKDLAMLLGIKPTSLANVENGWVAPWPKLRRNAARVLGCSEEDLFGLEHPPRSQEGA